MTLTFLFLVTVSLMVRRPGGGALLSSPASMCSQA
jgi:hypothetical protein